MTINELEAIMLSKRERYIEANDRVVKPLDSETAAHLSKLLSDAHFARDTWVIARDFGVSAALMFKLSAGAIDSRYRAT